MWTPMRIQLQVGLLWRVIPNMWFIGIVLAKYNCYPLCHFLWHIVTQCDTLPCDPEWLWHCRLSNKGKQNSFLLPHCSSNKYTVSQKNVPMIHWYGKNGPYLLEYFTYSEPKKCPNDLLMLKDWFISQELLIGIKWFMYHWKGLHHSFPKQVTSLHNIA